MAKRYSVECLQGTDFMSWTSNKPVSEETLREAFNGFYQSDNNKPMPRDFTFEDIEQHWNVRIYRVEG